jgi:hypothetical protein
MKNHATTHDHLCPPRERERSERARPRSGRAAALGGHGRDAHRATRRWGATLLTALVIFVGYHGLTYAAPGTITAEATKEGFERAQAKQDGAKGGSVQMSLTLAPRKTKEVPPVPPRSMVPAYVPGGVGGAALIVGVVSSIVAVQTGDDAGSLARQITANGNTSACRDRSDASCEALLGKRKDQGMFENAAFWSFLAAGGAGAGALIYVLLDRPGTVQKGALIVSPTTTAGGGAGMVVSGSW